MPQGSVACVLIFLKLLILMVLQCWNSTTNGKLHTVVNVNDMGVFVMPMIRIFGIVLLIISWLMVLIGYSYKKSDLQKQGCMVFIIGLLIFAGSYFLNWLNDNLAIWYKPNKCQFITLILRWKAAKKNKYQAIKNKGCWTIIAQHPFCF